MVIEFGPFRFAPAQRLLTKNGIAVEIGGRAVDILAALVARANEVVGKKELLAQVWPDTIVEEGNLRFHMSSLRRALGDGRGGARYIATVGGRGYCFVAPLAFSTAIEGETFRRDPGGPPTSVLQGPVELIGRAEAAELLVADLAATRLVTVVGAGGLGKTALAVAVGNKLRETFGGAVLFFDLGTLADAALVAPTLASMLGLSVAAEDPIPALIAFLRGRRSLVILDTCEHLVEAVASLASAVLAGTTDVHMLATSREALRVPGERVFPIPPLAYPALDQNLNAASALAYSAIQLFLERAQSGGRRIALTDANAATVAEICRRLDGVPLAIELAAGRVAAHGLTQLAQLLDEHFELLWPGHRTAPPRQRTLQATLDWSYRLLGTTERSILRGLSVFVGSFALLDAAAVLVGPTSDRAQVITALDELVAKSIVSAHPSGESMRYRLLDTTRAYLLQLPPEDATFADLRARHAIHYRTRLTVAGTRWPSLVDPPSRALHLAELNNARAALEWAFGTSGDTREGIQTAVAAGPVLLSMSLLPECKRWSERAIAALSPEERGSAGEMHLQAALGIALMFMHGASDAAGAALARSLTIAEHYNDARTQLSLLGPLSMFHLRAGRFRDAFRFAERSRSMLAGVGDPVATGIAHSILGTSLHFAGAAELARPELERALLTLSDGELAWTTTDRLGFEASSLAQGILARCLWLQGLEAEALERAADAVRLSRRIQHPVSLCIALIWAVTVSLWAEDLGSAERQTTELSACAEANGLQPYRIVARGFVAELAILQGDLAAGIQQLRACIAELHATPYELVTTHFEMALAQGLSAASDAIEALSIIERTMHAVERNGDLCYRPELLRIKGQLLLSLPEPFEREARLSFIASLRESRIRGTRAWERKTATELAKLLKFRGHQTMAERLLQRRTP